VGRSWLDVVAPEPRSAEPSLDPWVQLNTLLETATESLAAGLACLQAHSYWGVFAAGRFLAEALVIERWLVEPTVLEERERRAAAWLRGTLDRLDRATTRANDESVLDDKLVSAIHTKLQARMQESEGIERISIPGRPDLFRRYLPGGYAVFASLSELSLHPGPGTTLLLRNIKPSDHLFWLSTLYSLYVSVLAEFATALHKHAWIRELGDLLEAADPVVRTAWPDDYWPELTRPTAAPTS